MLAACAAFLAAVLGGAGFIAMQSTAVWTRVLSGDGPGFGTWYYMHQRQKMGLSVLMMHDAHPTRGWTPKPNLRATGTHEMVTNGRGHRASEEYAFQSGKFRILTVGDSFTFGDDDREDPLELSRDSVWADRLQRMDDRFQVINLGVGGYGTDQAYLMLRENMGEFRPHVVIFAMNNLMMTRCMVTFRDFAKPRFVLDEKGALVLTNTPIGTEEEVHADLLRRYGGVLGCLRLLREDRAFRRWETHGDYHAQMWRLNERIVQDAMQCTRDAGAEFLLAHLAYSFFINPPSDGGPLGADPGEDFVMEFAKNHPTPIMDTRPAFLAAGHPISPGHYKSDEAKFVGELMCRQVYELDSWRRFMETTPVQEGPKPSENGAGH